MTGPDYERLSIVGRALHIQGRDDEAVVTLEAACRHRADQIENWFTLGEVQNSLGHFDDAIYAYDRACALKPSLSRALVAKGRLLFERGRYEDSNAVINQALAQNKYDVVTLELSCLILLKTGQHEDAISTYKRVLSLGGPAFRDWRDPKLPNRLRIRARELELEWAQKWKAKGEMLLALARFSEAVEAFDHTLDLVPPDAGHVWKLKEAAFRELGHEDAALDAEGRA